MKRFVAILPMGLLVLLLASSIGAFLLYVAALPVLIVSLSVIALAIIFALGIQVGRQLPIDHENRNP